MRKTNRLWIALAIVAGIGVGVVQAQESKPAPAEARPAQAQAQDNHFYRLEFVVKELDGNKVIDSRSYTASIGSASRELSTSIRVGSKVPMYEGAIYDTGVNIDIGKTQELPGRLSLYVVAEMNSIQRLDAENVSKTAPVIRKNRWSATVAVPLGKPTTIFSSDDAVGTHKIQIELTATPIR